jgi:hypothetical protein
VKYFLRKMRLSGSTSSYQHGQTAGGGCAWRITRKRNIYADNGRCRKLQL